MTGLYVPKCSVSSVLYPVPTLYLYLCYVCAYECVSPGCLYCVFEAPTSQLFLKSQPYKAWLLCLGVVSLCVSVSVSVRLEVVPLCLSVK